MRIGISFSVCFAQAPDTTLDEMVERLREERAVTIVRTAVWKFLDRHGQTHKKNRSRQ
jgi:transposase